MSDGPSGDGIIERNSWEDDQRRSEVVRDGGADIDRFFDALSDTHRRLVLLYLNDTDCGDLDQLAESIAEHEGGDTSDETIERIRVELHHRHLPKLADHGLVSYDARTSMVCLEPLPRAVEKILDLTRDLEEPNER